MPNIQIDKINYVIKGETGNIINLDISENGQQTFTKTFLTDCGYEVANISSTTMTHRIIKTSSSNNKNIFFDMIGSDSIIYALFDFKDVAVKSSTGIDLYAPHLSSDPIGFCTVVNSNSKIISYGISEATSISPLIKGTNLRDTREDRIAGLTNSMFWNYKMIESGNKTYLGIPLSNLTLADTDLDDEVSSESVSSYFHFLQSYGKLSTDMVSTFFDPKYNLENINRNYIYQIPLGGSNTKMFNDFNSGNINGDFIIGKNPYNSEYSMDMSAVSELKNARQYDGIGTIGGRVFFKYRDDIDYKHNSDETLSTSLSSFLQNLSTISSDTSKINNFQKVEMLDSISQFKSVSQHKSNLFSIKIKKLFDNITDETILNNLTKIKDDISRKISKIVESFAPAHTQLFDIVFDNKSGAEENSQSNMGIIGDIIFLFTDLDETEISGLTKRGQYTTCLKIPKTVTSIQDGALNQSFENIIFLIESGNTTFEVKNNSLYESSSNTLISYPVNNSAASYVISEDTSAIYTSAFYNTRNLNILYKPLLLSNIVDLDVPEHLTIFDYYHYIIHFLNDGNEDTNLMPPLSVYSYEINKLGENQFTKTGYKFKYWEYNFEDKTKEISDNSYIETHLSPDYNPVNLSATWDPITYYVEFSKNNDNSISGNNFSISCLYDHEYNLSSYSNKFTKTGYKFDGWKQPTTNKTFSKDAVISKLTPVDKNTVIFNAEFDPHTYIVGFTDVSNFILSGIINETFSAEYDNYYNLSNFINEYKIISTDEYILSAWTFGEKFTQNLPLYEDEINGFKVYALRNLTAEDGATVYLSSVWTPKYYVKYDSGVSDNSVSGTTLSQYFAFGDKARNLSKNGFSRELYFFDGWKCGNETYSDGEEVEDLTETPGEILIFTARWNEKFTVIFDGNGATSGSMENQYFSFNNSQDLYKNQFTKTGYEFKGWSFEKYSFNDSDIISSEINYYYDGTKSISFTVNNLNKDEFDENRQCILYAVWEPNVYKVRFNKNFLKKDF